MTTLAVLGAGLLVAAAVQSATGFGFALVAGPLVYAVLEPVEAVALIVIVGMLVSLLVLLGERRRPRLLWREIGLASAAALPGLPLGLLVIRVVPAAAMTAAVGLIVGTLCAVRLLRRGAPARGSGARTWRAAVLAGFAVGVLTTSTTTSGPPLAIWLTGRRLEPAVIRDVVTVIFLGLDVAALATVLAIAGREPLPPLDLLLPLLGVVVVGHAIGMRAFRRLPARAFEPIVLTVALVAAIAAVGSVLVAAMA